MVFSTKNKLNIAALLAIGAINEATAPRTALQILNSGQRGVTQIDLALSELVKEYEPIKNIAPGDRTDDQKKRAIEIVNLCKDLREERDQLREMDDISNSVVGQFGSTSDSDTGTDDQSDGYAQKKKDFENYVRTGKISNLTSADGGGVQVPEEKTGALFEKMKGFAPILSDIETTTTAKGGTIPIPVLDDTANSGRLRTSETEDNNVLEPVVTGFSLGDYLITADKIPVSYKLLRDSSYDVESKVNTILNNRLARKAASLAISGSGTGEPMGMVTAAGITVNSGNASDITSFEPLIDMIGAVDSAYSSIERASYKISNKMFVRLLRLRASLNKYRSVFVQVGKNQWELNGYSVQVVPQMDGAGEIAANEYHALFGWFKAYQMRVVGTPRIHRSTANMTKNETIELAGFWDIDGDLADTNALCKLRIAANS